MNVRQVRHALTLPSDQATNFVECVTKDCIPSHTYKPIISADTSNHNVFWLDDDHVSGGAGGPGAEQFPHEQQV